MVRDSLIRRLGLFVRHHFWDGALAVLCLGAVVIGGPAAVSGFALLADRMVPGIAPPVLQVQGEEGRAGLSLLGFGGSPHAPTVLFPLTARAMPAWLRGKPEGVPVHGPSSHNPVIALCIDDLGENLTGTAAAIALPREVALAFLPYADGTSFMADRGFAKGHEILAHVPMQAFGPEDPGPMALRLGLADNDARLNWSLARVPHLIGVNNHEGSKFTADADAMRGVMRILAQRHLFFFDSRTSGMTKGEDVARAFGIPSAGRDIFLDDTVSAEEITRQLAALEAKARRDGVAIAIGHPHDVTLKLVAAWLAQNHGVKLVPLTQAMALKRARQMASR